MSLDLIQALCVSREAEREQALFYHRLAVEAEERGDGTLSKRLYELKADEQRHESSIAARLLELGAVLPELATAAGHYVPLDQWEPHGRRRERDEVKRYELLLVHDLDGATAALIRQIMDMEHSHERELGGTWIPA